MIGDLIDQWWEATREHRLLVQRCADCGAYQHYPRPVCLACLSTDVSFGLAAGTGTVWSFTEVERAPAPGVEVPYTVALVRLAEGPVLLTHLVCPDPACDEPVRLRWRALDDGRALPVFDRATKESHGL